MDKMGRIDDGERSIRENNNNSAFSVLFLRLRLLNCWNACVHEKRTSPVTYIALARLDSLTLCAK